MRNHTITAVAARGSTSWCSPGALHAQKYIITVATTDI
eukprot:CAMPEP_0119528806 /NCGR_PEP_ID=MMETSP1344-20130328/42912_1 /TAXON_ID=236787 /ORGANISM="Florenciella parvula, Strain CCMP2471" /LENGTH=37 /DNA_ID= /DNA_START= /DNA_END= /DNA_ORIENTATION=